MTSPHDVLRTIDAPDVDRHRYNAAFDELGLGWHWDEKTYAELQASRRDRHLVHAYVETCMPHLLAAYDGAFLVGVVETKRSELGGGAHESHD